MTTGSRMSIGILAAGLAAAFLHALWNTLNQGRHIQGRRQGDPVPGERAYWDFVADGLFFSPGMIARRGRARVPRCVRARMTGLFAAASCGAYPISVRAMTIARFALMAALRGPLIQCLRF
jgi:hypothetical protein